MDILKRLRSIFSMSSPKNTDLEPDPKNTDIESEEKNLIEVNMNYFREEADEINPIYLKELEGGVLPGELILMNWLDGNTIHDTPPKYFSYCYGINPIKSTEKLIKAGYLAESSPYEALPSLKVSELKEILRNNNLKLSGNKSDLVKRITENVSEDIVKGFITKKPLKITKMGKELMKKYHYIVDAHKYGSGILNVANAIEYVTNFKGNYIPTSRDISWALLQKNYLKNMKNKDYGLARNDILRMAEQTKRENRLKDSLVHYLRVFIMDMSGMHNNNSLDPPELIIIAPGISSAINSLIIKIGLKEEELKKLFDEAWNGTRPSLPFHYLTLDECYACLESYRNGDEEYIKELINKSYKKINKKYLKEKYDISLPVER